jgi:hypothetical protein
VEAADAAFVVAASAKQQHRRPPQMLNGFIDTPLSRGASVRQQRGRSQQPPFASVDGESPY